MYMPTTWENIGKARKKYPALKGNTKADVVIVGGGLSGVLNAYFLSKAGKKVVLIESNKLGSNATAMTTAIITEVIDSSLTEIIDIYDSKSAKTIWKSGEKAILEIENIIQREKIDCEFKLCPNYFFASNQKQYQELVEEASFYKKLGLRANLHQNVTNLNFPNFGYLEIPNQAKFHPLKFLFGVAKAAAKRGAKIYERTEAIQISEGDPFIVKTKKGNITSKDVVVTTYKPLTNEKTHLKKAMYQSYVLEAEIPKDILGEAVYEDNSNPYYYFRVDRGSRKDRLIVGGEDHKDIFGDTLLDKSFKGLENFLKQLLPGVKYKIVKKWNGPILEPTDGLPLIGRIKPHLYVATAFSGNGMTYSAISAILIRDLVLGRKNNWQKIYDPKRALLEPKRLATKAKDYIEELFGGALKNLLEIK